MSAISDLLQQLTAPPVAPGGPATGMPGISVTPSGFTPPPPQAAPMPQVQAPPQPLGLVGRIRGLLGGGAGPSASGYEGLLSPAEINGTRISLGDRLAAMTPGAPSVGQTRQARLDHMIALKNYAQQMADAQTSRERAQGIQAVRLKAGEMFAAKPNETPQQSAQRMMQHGLFLMGQGDEEGGAKMLSAVGQLSKVLEGPAAIKPVNPVVGSPEWKAAEEFKAALAAKYRVEPSQIMQALGPDKELHFYRIPKDGGDPVLIPDITPKPTTGGMGSAAAQKVIAANKAQMSVIDDAVSELGKHPDAVGMKRGLGELPMMGNIGDSFNQRKDPEGVAARAQIANVGSLIVHDRSGAAVTVSEYPRLAPFVPKVTDTPDAIRVKLGKLRAAIETETRLYQEGIGKKDAPTSAAPAPAEKKTITKDQADFLRSKKGMTDADIGALYVVKP